MAEHEGELQNIENIDDNDMPPQVSYRITLYDVCIISEDFLNQHMIT